MRIMRRLVRIALNALTLASLLLMVAGAAVWVRGYVARDDIAIYPWGFHEHSRYPGITAGHNVRLAHYRGRTQVTHYYDTCVIGKNRRPFDRCEHTSRLARVVEAERPTLPDRGTTLGFRHRAFQTGTEWLVPDYAVTLPFGVLPVARLAARARRKRTIAQGCCPTCGYDLRASPDRCPECGTARPATIALPLPA